MLPQKDFFFVNSVLTKLFRVYVLPWRGFLFAYATSRIIYCSEMGPPKNPCLCFLYSGWRRHI